MPKLFQMLQGFFIDERFMAGVLESRMFIGKIIPQNALTPQSLSHDARFDS
jgi:hypothetical protein